MKSTIKLSVPVIIVLYLISNIFMLLNNGRYWDDWCLSSPAGIDNLCKSAGIPFMIPIHSILHIAGEHTALTYHMLIVFFEVLGIFIFYKCLRLLNMDKHQAIIITLIFALIPYNSAKETMVCLVYSIGHLLFIIACFLFLTYKNSKRLFFRLFSLVFFFFSFLFIPSTLIFELAFLFLMIILDNGVFKLNFKNLLVVAKDFLKYADFIIIPFAFWIFRSYFLLPEGIYAESGYRTFSMNSIILLPYTLFITFIQNFLGLFTFFSLSTISGLYIVISIIFTILLYIILNRSVEWHTSKFYLFLIGFFLFLAGAFSYNAVNLYPVFENFESRHQILLKAGSAIMLYYLINVFISNSLKNLVLALIIALFSVSTVSRQLQYQKSWFKQLALETKLVKEEELLTDGVNFLILDKTNDYNEYDRPIAIHCFSGILNKAFGNQTRFAVDLSQLEYYASTDSTEFTSNALYHMKNCKNFKSFKYVLEINHGNILLSNVQSIKMLYKYYFKRSEFNKELQNLLVFNIIPNNGSIFE